jgi:hypothetical protein
MLSPVDPVSYLNAQGWRKYIAHLVYSRLLVRHDLVMNRLRLEVANVVGDLASPTREQIRTMAFLAYVIKESAYNTVQKTLCQRFLTLKIPRSSSLPSSSTQ